MPTPKRVKTQMAQNLIKYRKAFGFTQQKVADMLNIKRSTYGYYEISTYPPLAIMKKLANMYNISIDELAGDPIIDLFPELPELEELRVAQPEIPFSPTLSTKDADESELLSLYRMLPAEDRIQARDALRQLVDKIES